MTALRHGFSIGIERMNDEFFLTLKAKGKLTHSDYLAMTPVIDSALAEVKHPQIKALFDATELEGWELSAAWDDFKLGLKHGNQFVKLALYGNKGWQEIATKIGNWFIAGEIRYFESETEALDWLKQ